MSTVTTTYKVTGMSCGHCETAISQEVSEIDGVSSVKAVASAGEVTIVTAGEPDDAAVGAAIDEAGYELAGRV
ncbi:copper chaperone [Streptomyces sp. AJS327]|uniref:heavy-metal-associated domain-containing protein n=1 Tax=Streptomyces sp. AJS327 TaxID=2545265 RepID=UPI0015DED691|nr:cation transporter [Streptomyces sp. AJS327]MBA0049696.1 copper chaperone [Streptomyces sp. AJS327]